jgi:hypothetical protein
MRCATCSPLQDHAHRPKNPCTTPLTSTVMYTIRAF